MNRVNIKQQILNAIILFLIQLPLLYRTVLFDRAFAFFYVGFLLLLPRTLSRSSLMILGFLVGLVVDIFSNTPGMHAAACVAVMFLRNFWLFTVSDDAQELTNLDMVGLKKRGFILYIFPLVFVHHLLIFFIENGGFHLFGMVMSKVFFSTIFSSIIIYSVSYVVSPKGRRL